MLSPVEVTLTPLGSIQRRTQPASPFFQSLDAKTLDGKMGQSPGRKGKERGGGPIFRLAYMSMGVKFWSLDSRPRQLTRADVVNTP